MSDLLCVPNSQPRPLIRKIKIQYRLLAVFLFISLIPAVCIGLYAYRVYTRSINNKISDSALQTIRSINANMTTELGKYQDYCSTLSVTDAVQQSLLATANGVPVTREMVLDVRETSVTIPLQSSYLKNLWIVGLDGQTIYDRGYDGIPAEKSEEIIQMVERASPQDSLQYIHTYRAQNKLVLGRKLYSVDFSGRPIGYIMVYFDEQLIQESIIADVTFGPGSNIMLVDGDGDVLSSQDRSLLGQSIAGTQLFQAILEQLPAGRSSFPLSENGSDGIGIAVHNEVFDCYLVASIPMSYITEETRDINIALLWLALALILLSLLLTLVTYISILNPIRNIIAACNITSDDDLNVRINDPNKDELGFLARTIDRMVDEIQMLMDRRRKEQTRRRELELENLQYQINPHFLFNTLNSLQWVATINDVPAVAEGLSSLSALLRNTIMKKDEFIPLSQEVETLSHYFAIQKIRYGNSFDVCYSIDPRTADRRVPRFVLQPLAENAIIHGTENMPAPITITVSSTVDEAGNMIVEVQDNGHGFSIPEAQKRGKDRFSGIGVNNVAERLHIYYGDAGGLTVESEVGCGTVCRILIPQDNAKEEVEE